MKEQSVVGQPHTPSFDSTQTLRALTIRELQDPQQQKWFAVQLAVSDRPVNLETMPRLDVLAAYRLYAVEGRQGTAIRYALRLGFFMQEDAAWKICEEVKMFFRSPSIVRVSAAEQARFKAPKTTAMPAQKPAGQGAPVVDLSSARRGTAAAPNQSSESRKPSAASSKLKLDKSLSRGLLEEARQVELSRSGGRQVSKQASWLGRLLGRPKS